MSVAESNVIDTKEAMIVRLANQLRKQETFEVLTDKEVTERYGKKVDPDFVRCYYPNRLSPYMISCYVKRNFVWIVCQEEDFKLFKSEDAEPGQAYRNNLFKFKVVECYEGGLDKTAKVVLEMFDYAKRMGIDKKYL